MERHTVNLKIRLRGGVTAEMTITVNEGPRIPAPMEQDRFRAPHVWEVPEIAAKLRRLDCEIEGGEG